MALKNKYQRQKQQYSNDSGLNWYDVSPANYRKGRLIEEASSDCNTIEWQEVTGSWFCLGEYVPPTPPTPGDYSTQYLTFVALEDGTFTFTPKNNNVIYYSTDNGTTWTEGNSVSVNSGDKVFWKGTMTPAQNVPYNSGGIGTFSATGNFDVQGNPMSLLFGDNFIGQTNLTEKNNAFYRLFYQNTKVINAKNLSLSATTLANYCYYGMFSGCTSLVTAPVLPATTLVDRCYSTMFFDCTSLTTAPVLPATTLASSCYSAMFQGCTSLTTAPSLPATTLASGCYHQMFYECRSLTTAPSLPATTLASGCYQGMFSWTGITTAPSLPATTLAQSCYSGMFEYCKRLVTAPELPVTTLAEYCYAHMFYGCISLVTAPELPATTLAKQCYYVMFRGCTSLVNAPVLSATTLAEECYRGIFQGCTSLNYIKCLATDISATNCTTDWVRGIVTSGTFIKAASMSNWTTGVNGIPSGWTVVTE